MAFHLYQELLRDHYRNPRHRGVLLNPDFSSGQHNPSCGDEVTFMGRVADGVITEIAHTGAGCVISLGTASLLAEVALGKSCNELLTWTAADIKNLIGMELGPNRLRCALLPLEALQQGIREHA